MNKTLIKNGDVVLDGDVLKPYSGWWLSLPLFKANIFWKTFFLSRNKA